MIRILAVVAMSFVLICHGCTKQEAPSYSGPPTKMIIGAPKGESVTVLYALEQLGICKKMGIDFELREFDSGVAAMTALNQGHIDLAAASDFVFASNIDKNPDLRIVAGINRSNNTFIIAQKNRGINKPADLKGKKIAVTLTSIGDYFLGKYLSSNRLKPEDVTMVNMTPSMMEKEIVTGNIDAAIAWDPVARRMRDILGPNANIWPAQAESPYHMVLVARDSFIKKESAAMLRLMKSLVLAEKSIETDPAAVQRYLSKRIGMPEKYFSDIWGDNQFKLFLDRSLLLTLEEESRWIIKTRGMVETSQPNYLKYLYLDALKTVRPESVTIIN